MRHHLKENLSPDKDVKNRNIAHSDRVIGQIGRLFWNNETGMTDRGILGHHG